MFVRFRKHPLLYFSNFLFELFLVAIIVLSNQVSCQDNKPPTFSATQYIFEVSEDAQVGDILNVTNPPLSEIFAMDSEGDNITYGKVDPSNSPQFSLNLTTGSLSIAQTLDRETTSFYSFEIFANDSQRNGEFLPTVSVQIVILDVNDNPPIFLNSYNFSLDEGVSSGHQVNPSDNPISVSDDDIGNNQPSTFSIVSGDDGRFTIDQNGNILTTLDDSEGVNRTIDFETKPFYNLTVRATNTEPRDSVLVFSETFVAITILNINDEDPEFTPASTGKIISINEMATGVVFTIQAIDIDGPLPVPTTFAYSIIYGNQQLNGIDSFSINPTTGAVSVGATGLDHETFAEYNLIIQAQENQTPQTSILTSLIIFVTDVNEYAPAFTSSSYQANISEASSIGRAILQVETTDSDLTSSVSYSFDSAFADAATFDIDSVSGLISLNAAVDREAQSSYAFQVLAINSDSTGSHTASATVSISLLDVNDNSPAFGMSEISISIGEQNPIIPLVIYDVVMNNIVTDIDEGVNKQVKYSLQTGDSVFSIDADTGFVSVLAILDYDVQSRYILTIIATDQAILASDRRTGSFILNINIIDVNDNSPVLLFINSHTVEENLQAGSTIFTVTATDSDTALTVPLVLTILGSAPFSLSSTGSTSPTFISREIQTDRPLDFEANGDKSFQFTIVVSDGSKMDSGIVSITTEDVNDNIPIFTQLAGYTFNVAEIQTGLIGTVNANDDDSAEFGLVNYMITGDNDNNFLIDSATGEISIVKALEGDPHASYMFSVVASDSGVPPLATVAVVTVPVEDINDNPPILRLDNPQVSIFENMSYDSIFIFIADDLDRTSPNNIVEYFIIDSFPVLSQLSSFFVINQTTGELSTGASPINREDFAEISLTIAAMDQGSPMLSDTTTIHIIINDKNDNRPVFESPSYFVNVDEDFLLGEIILQVRATESSPDANTQISYSLMNTIAALPNNPLQYVSIDSGTGAISLSRSLDFENLRELSLLIIASDGLNTDVSSLTISVNNVNDNDPTLSISTCTRILPENRAVGTFCTLNVADADIDGTSNFTIAGFSLSPTLPQFQILFNAGASVVNLILTQTLDFETTKSFLIEISVTDSGLPSSRTTSLSLQLNVTGINEFSPSFASSNYIFTVDESEGVGFVVGVVTATDLDDPSTDDGKFSYNIFSQSTSFSFQIDDSTGLISLRSQVDYEAVVIFVFVVNAVDKATSMKTGATSVTIHVIDSNEYTPVFTNTPFSTSIPENVAEGHSVIQITATDSDRDDVITYSILDGNNDGVFRIDSNTGEIFTTSISLDFEITQRYIIIVQAADNGTGVRRQSSIPVNIVILDVNDNAPVFDRPPVNSFVNEGGANLFVMLVSATDLDSTINAQIQYSVDLNSDFEINAAGILTTKIALDRESTSSYLTTICASDGGTPSLSICESVTISIQDINDNSPSFNISSLTSVNVPENTNGGQVIVTLTVNDLDSNPIFFFTLFSDGGPFSISSSGSVATVILSGTSLITPLDREKRSMYSLIITVSDQVHSATHTLQVTVTDVNDETPTFQNDTYILLTPVLESALDGTSVVNVSAIDLDISPNNLIIYSLLVSAEGRFRIESDTGLISVNTATEILDFEISKSHTLIVQSSDGNLVDTAFVFIPIGDVNDNDPVFFENSYSIQVLETVSIGTTILAVQATDADSGVNGNIIYIIVTNNIEIMNTFDLNATTGILKTISTLDVDSQSNFFTFQISASDTSSSPRTVLVDVMITVLAENEDIPVFNETLYMSFVGENLNPVISILTLFASENDSNAIIQYDIVDSGAKAYFDVNRTSGVLFLINPLDRELFADFTFTVVASDNDFPPRQGFSSVRISITDLNDNSPTFLLREYSVSISESTPVNSEIITVRATDNDATAAFNQIQYGIVSSVVDFSIDPNTGIVTVSANLDFDQDPNIFRLSLSASDPGSNSDTALLIIYLLDENDINPRVLNSDLSRTISESALGGTEVITLTVEDLDTVGIITYEIASGNTDNSFVIDSSGRITVSVNGLDFETVPSFNLGILISDGIHSISPSVLITITDSNDNAPMFNQESYSISINEDNLVNTNILNFSVEDPDVGDDGSISLYIEASTNIGNIFKLGNSGPISNNINSMILSALSLDRETPGLSLNSSDGSALWNLKIIAFDNSADISKRLTSTADIFITLEDINDNAPKFSSPSYSAQVSESSNIGTLVLTLSASDMDFGLNSIITFNLDISSSNSGNFTLNNISGELRTALILSRETSSVFVFNVEVSDGSLKDVALVTVTITDINDHNPVFSNSMLTAIISENSPIGTNVAVLAANDEDDGDNGRITISIIGGDSSSQFRINNGIPGMAQLEVAKDNIDREIQSSFELIIAAQDHGTPNRQGTSTVQITIRDVNDNPPIFSPMQYFGTISEASTDLIVTLNTPIVINDADLGMNSQFVISLDITTVFTIDNSARTISLQNSITLDRETEDSFEINLIAQDSGSPSMSSTATLSISVEDINDNSPIFSPPTYMSSVNEAVAISTSIITVYASDADIGANGDLSYSIISGSEGNFQIDRENGLVETSDRLDREANSVFNLIVAAFDKGSPFLSGTTTVIVTVTDFNDNSPIFMPSHYTASVEEDERGICVVKLNATDNDLGENAVLKYAFLDPIAGSSLPFSIDADTGEICITGQLDRESTDIYSFEVVVRDNAFVVLNRLTSTTTVIITIIDVNDVAPSFPGVNAFMTSIQESTRITTIILSPVATDPDLGVGGDIFYSISPESSIFSVGNTTGQIMLIQSLDFDSTGSNGLSEYRFDLVVTDNGIPSLNSSIPVIINVLDENDNVPVFDLPFYSVAVLENITIGTTFIILNAQDNDTNGVINYQIVGGNLNGLFEIDLNTGGISNALSLANLTAVIFELTIRAFESLDISKFSLTSLHIEITDTNDNAPFFCQTASYEFFVPENTMPFKVGPICGLDRDSGINGQFEFSIISGDTDSAFGIEQISGASTADIVVLNNVLDRERVDMYTLSLQISDKGIPQLRSTPIVAIISILDVNDETPTFVNLPNFTNLSEGIFGGTEVFLVLANDSDISSNAIYFFEIISGNDDDVFRIEPETGRIITIKALNFNLIPRFSLSITVTDRGIPPRSSTSTLEILIEDINDHAPLFMPPYEKAIPEDLPSMSFIILVMAFDDDATTNAALVYNLSMVNNASYFNINNTGHIFLNTTSLDRETQDLYNLVVTACDMGSPVLCTSVDVIVIITDTNDHAPVFSQPEYSFAVLENNPSIIGTVFATDLDDGTNGMISYSISSGVTLFNISEVTGEISAPALDRENQNFYQFTVQAVDNGTISNSNTVLVNITVLDVNDNLPMIMTSVFSSQVKENTRIGSIIFDVDAIDIDLGTNSEINYFILGGNQGDFDINPDSGQIFVNKTLDAERTINYGITIQASDNGIPPLSDIQTLIINIIDINEHPPIFSVETYTAFIPENSIPPLFLLNVTASDSDLVGSENSEISYFLPPHFSTNYNVNSLTGMVTTNIIFDREVSSFDTFIIMANNPNSSPMLEGSATVRVIVTDANDKTPYFSLNIYSTEISELSQVGNLVLVLIANDDDDPNLLNSKVVFSSSPTNSPEFDASFRVNFNGSVIVNGPLDRETLEVYSALVVASDQGIPELSNTSQLSITLTDENDIPPTFDKSVYLASYKEDMDPSSQNGLSRLILNLGFTDGDKDIQNKQSIFSFSSNSPFHFPEFNVTNDGSLFLNIGLDRETRDNYTLYLEVINQLPGHPHGSYCAQSSNSARARFINNQCWLFHSSIVYLSVVDINDNFPVFSSSPFHFTVSYDSLFNSEVGTVSAKDADLSIFSDLIYSISGTSDFLVDEITGIILTNTIFTGRVGEVLQFAVSASDQATNNSLTSNENVIVSVISELYVFHIFISDSIENTRLCIDDLLQKLRTITGFQVHISTIQESILGSTILLNETVVSFYSFQITDSILSLVPHFELIRQIDDNFLELQAICGGNIDRLSSVIANQIQLSEPSIQFFLILAVCAFLFLCGCIANILSIYQRVLGKRSLTNSDKYAYSGMEGLDILTAQNDLEVNQAFENIPSREEITFESQELKMDLFLDDFPDDAFLTGSEITNSNTMISENEVLNYSSIDDDDVDISISSI